MNFGVVGNQGIIRVLEGEGISAWNIERWKGWGLFEDETRYWSVRAVPVGCRNMRDWRRGYIRDLGLILRYLLACRLRMWNAEGRHSDKGRGERESGWAAVRNRQKDFFVGKSKMCACCIGMHGVCISYTRFPCVLPTTPCISFGIGFLRQVTQKCGRSSPFNLREIRNLTMVNYRCQWFIPNFTQMVVLSWNLW